MRKLIEASLVLSLSVVLTLLIMAFIFPRHVLGGGDQMLEPTAIRPAVFVEGTHHRPGWPGSPSAPKIADQNEGLGCPYLAALEAASRCPVITRSGAKSPCPYLLQLHWELLEREYPPTAPHGQTI
jgi:hypothetical protein